MGGMDVTLLFFDGCPNWMEARRRLRDAARRAGLDEGVVKYRKVATPEEAEKVRFRGSPTILIEGRDPFSDESVPAGLACRIYQTPSGPDGAPSTDQLVAVLKR
jgi:hypothetical protein